MCQLVVFGAYAFHRTRRLVSVAIVLTQIAISVPVWSVSWLLSIQFAPPIAPLIVASAIGWGLAGGVVDPAHRKGGLTNWLLYWVLAGTVLSIGAYVAFFPMGDRSEWFVVNPRFK